MPYSGAALAPSQGGQKAQFAHNFQEIHFLLHFYVTIFWNFQSQGGQLTTPLAILLQDQDCFCKYLS